MARVIVCVLTLALVGQASAQNRAEAQDAFERGRKQMKDGDFKAACASFETSLRLDPTAGTLYNLGLCHEKLGKLASAWTELKEVAANDPNKARAADAAKHVATLEPRLTRFKLVVPEPIEGLVVEREGIDITPLVGQTVPVDPRRYTFTAKVPGKPPITFEAALDREGETIEVSIPKPGVVAPPPIVPVVPTGYPAQLALRPITMPDGHVEVTAANSITTSASTFEQTPIDGLVLARIGIQKFELGLNASLHERYPQSTSVRPSPLQTIGGTLAYAVTPVLAGRLEYTRLHPVGDLGDAAGGSDLRVVLADKQLLAPKVALDGTAGFVFFQRDNGGDNSKNELVGEAVVNLQLTATQRLSLEAGALLQLNLGGELLRSYTVALGVAPRALFAVTDQVDVFAKIFVGLLPAAPNSSSSDLRSYTIGLNWRH